MGCLQHHTQGEYNRGVTWKCLQRCIQQYSSSRVSSGRVRSSTAPAKQVIEVFSIVLPQSSHLDGAHGASIDQQNHPRWHHQGGNTEKWIIPTQLCTQVFYIKPVHWWLQSVDQNSSIPLFTGYGLGARGEAACQSPPPPPASEGAPLEALPEKPT